MLEHNTRHSEDAIELLPNVWLTRLQFRALLGSFTEQAQLLEDAIFDAIVRQGIDEVLTGYGHAVGVALDAIGKIVGEPRMGKTDDDYIPFIRAKVKTNKSDGNVPQLIEILDLIIGADTLMRIRNFGGMEAEIAIDEVLTDAEAEAVNRFMLLAIDAVLELQVSYTYVDPSEVFTLSDTYATFGVSASKGMGSEYSGTGGKLTHTRVL